MIGHRRIRFNACTPRNPHAARIVGQCDQGPAPTRLRTRRRSTRPCTSCNFQGRRPHDVLPPVNMDGRACGVSWDSSTSVLPLASASLNYRSVHARFIAIEQPRRIPLGGLFRRAPGPLGLVPAVISSSALPKFRASPSQCARGPKSETTEWRDIVHPNTQKVLAQVRRRARILSIPGTAVMRERKPWLTRSFRWIKAGDGDGRCGAGSSLFVRVVARCSTRSPLQFALAQSLR
jgi:hypothetical protein